MGSRLDTREHSRYAWRIRDIAPDFKLIDAWALPASGTLEDFADLGDVFAELGPISRGAGSTISRLLFTVRHWLGERLGWDRETNILPIPGCSESSLRDRLPSDVAP